MDAYAGTMSFRESLVQRELNDIGFPESRTRVVPGYIEQTLTKCNVPDHVAFAYVDLDFYLPTKTALEFLDDVVVAGGIVIVDDYGFFSSGVQKAVDRFLAARKNAYRVRASGKVDGFIVFQKM